MAQFGIGLSGAKDFTGNYLIGFVFPALYHVYDQAGARVVQNWNNGFRGIVVCQEDWA
ncbi:MAG TPA: hypothetical protein PLT26_13720 [Anaerolineaceae bacterium]|nr:hypothetical protein [Anaerolineaceae bacterium]